MATYNHDDSVSFDLPYDYELRSELNDSKSARSCVEQLVCAERKIL